MLFRSCSLILTFTDYGFLLFKIFHLLPRFDLTLPHSVASFPELLTLIASPLGKYYTICKTKDQETLLTTLRDLIDISDYGLYNHGVRYPLGMIDDSTHVHCQSISTCKAQ